MPKLGGSTLHVILPYICESSNLLGGPGAGPLSPSDENFLSALQVRARQSRRGQNIFAKFSEMQFFCPARLSNLFL